MKLAIAINENFEQQQAVLDFVSGLEVTSGSVDIVYVVEYLTMLDKMLGTKAFIESIEGSDYWERQKDWALTTLRIAQDTLAQRGITSSTKLLHGQVANELLAHCEKNNTDMLVLGHSGKGTTERLLLGSVGRKAVAAANCSVLVVKGKPASNRITAVLATDHSPYANRAFQQLKGKLSIKFASATVLTVITDRTEELLRVITGGNKLPETLEKVMELQNQELRDDLQDLAQSWDQQVRHGDVHQQILECMEAKKADLLVMAAQGHGFLDRLLVGNETMKELMTQTKSLLVLRNRL